MCRVCSTQLDPSYAGLDFCASLIIWRKNSVKGRKRTVRQKIKTYMQFQLVSIKHETLQHSVSQLYKCAPTPCSYKVHTQVLLGTRKTSQNSTVNLHFMTAHNVALTHMCAHQRENKRNNIAFCQKR